MEIFTIGHSNHKIESFINLLLEKNIDTIVDVRSSPYSKYNPQFNYEALKTELKKKGVKYVFMGEELGARRKEKEVYEKDGKVNLEKVKELELFKKGIERLIVGIKKGYKIAIMCSEKEPFECHRFYLISYTLQKKGIRVIHILENGDIIENIKLEKRFLSKVPNMFKTEEEEVEEGYKINMERIAFFKEDKE